MSVHRLSPPPSRGRMPAGQERGRKRSDACRCFRALDAMTWRFAATGSGSPSPGLRPPSPIKGEGNQVLSS